MLERDRERGFGGLVGEAGKQLGEGGVTDGARGPDAGHLAVVLHHPVGLDEPVGGDELHGVEHRGEGALLGPGDAVRLEAEAADAAGLLGEDAMLVGLGGADLNVGVDARRPAARRPESGSGRR